MTNDISNEYSNTNLSDLKSRLVYLADTLRTFDVIATRIRTGLSSDQLPNPVFRHHDIVGSTDGSDNDWDTPVRTNYDIQTTL